MGVIHSVCHCQDGNFDPVAKTSHISLTGQQRVGKLPFFPHSCFHNDDDDNLSRMPRISQSSDTLLTKFAILFDPHLVVPLAIDIACGNVNNT